MNRIPTPDPQKPTVRVEVINDKGEQYTVVAGGGLFVEVEDDVVEAIVTSVNPAGDQVKHAWTRDRGVETLKTFLDNKKLREKVAEFERRQKQQARKPRAEKKNEEVPASRDVSRKQAED